MILIMKIAYIHYHLKTGGVTTVLKQQAVALKDHADILVLTGAPPDSPFPAETVFIPGLGYDNTCPETFEPKEVARAIISAIFSKWKGGCDILHVHNPTMAKNRNFLKILKILQDQNISLFLQIHDFAEDGRPHSYFPEEYVSDCHYGVINSRDYAILLKTGLKKEGLHKVFNMINPFYFNEKSVSTKYILYPIRAIRRKNIGEAILLSLFFKNKAPIAITLPPNSPNDIASYKGWKNFVKANHLNVIFDAGLENKFESLLFSSAFLITTSITEGFGFSFLEPWAADKYLWGRKLPDICNDFEKNKIRLKHLYSNLLIPRGWIEKERLFQKQKLSIQNSCNLFNFHITKEEILGALGKTNQDETIDFGLLDEAFQKNIITRLLSNRTDRKILIDLNPYLASPAEFENTDHLIQSNKKAVIENYNEEQYRTNLLNIYERIINQSVVHHIDKPSLISEFLDIEAFSLLKWGLYAE